jgi:asparagine synthase (glutamine-hydrolysing)
MESDDGRYLIIFNGEIYNYKRIAVEMQRNDLTVASDTRVLLEGISMWGIELMLAKSIGMFAFCLWDRKLRVLSLVRDRIGVKPLYYGWTKLGFAASSELKPITKLFSDHLTISDQSLQRYFHAGFIPAPLTIYNQVFKLIPGSILHLDCERLSAPPPSFKPEPNGSNFVKYWSLGEIAQLGYEKPFIGTFNDATYQLKNILEDSIAIRMLSDVPLGAFLSGGIDSSLVTAIMQSQSSSPIRTFSIGMEDLLYDESAYAKNFADYLGTKHTSFTMSENEVLLSIPKIAQIFDEPFGDSSKIPTYLLSSLAKKEVSVALSGDGGDELFLGYTRYSVSKRIWPLLEISPSWVRSAIRKLITSAPVPILNRIFSWKSGKNPLGATFSQRLQRLADIALASTKHEYSFATLSHWRDSPLIKKPAPPILYSSIEKLQDKFAIDEYMALYDAETYLPDDIMVKVDRATMATSLEAREPLLDHRIFEFAYSLPASYRATATQTKVLMRQLLSSYAPIQMFDRPKRGFSMPLARWLCTGLRDWAEQFLNPAVLAKSGLINPITVSTLWERHLKETQDHSAELWDVIMFQVWYETHFQK